MPELRFQQLDVFSTEPFRGNPVAVVFGADALDEGEMSAFANWTNLSETTFLMKPTSPEADYRVRIFTPQRELAFAGHPTLGSCQAWLESGGAPKEDYVVQECGIGLVRIMREGKRLAFAAPPLRRSGAVEPDLLSQAAAGLRIEREAILNAQWVDNGSDWFAVLLRSKNDVLTLRPDYAPLSGLRVGVVGAWDPLEDGSDAQFEVRAFTAGGYEDPVTGSLNAGLALWLIGSGIAPPSYVASQGTVLGRRGRIHVQARGGEVWIGGGVSSCIRGVLRIGASPMHSTESGNPRATASEDGRV